MDHKGRLDRLDDAVLETILSMTPDEIIEGATDEEVAAARSNLANAVAKVGRERLARARNAVNADSRKPPIVGTVAGADALKEARTNDAAFDKKLTLAARKGGPDYQADKAGIEEDLEELGRWSREDGDPD